MNRLLLGLGLCLMIHIVVSGNPVSLQATGESQILKKSDKQHAKLAFSISANVERKIDSPQELRNEEFNKLQANS